MSLISKPSVLDESNSSFLGSDDEENNVVHPWQNLIHNFTIPHLNKLRKIFNEDYHKNAASKQQESPNKLSTEQFVQAVDTVMGNSKYSLQAISLYNEIPNEAQEKLTWHQFLVFLTNHILPKHGNDVQLKEADIFPVPHVQKETIMKIVLLESESSFCYAIISKYGKVGLYTGNFDLLTKYTVIFTRSDDYFKVKFRIRKSVWITDAAFLSNVLILVICTSTRSMVFYDASGQKHVPLWLIEGIPNVVHCLAYHCDNQSKLFMGNDNGSVTIVTFIQQTNGLLRKKYNDKLNTYYWRELPEETAHITIQTYKKIHSSLVISILYFHENYTFVSCSRDEKNSIVFYNLKERQKRYVFKISQDVSCYSISMKLHIFITGHDSGLVQIWNLYVTSKPIEILTGHKVSVIGVNILEYNNLLVSCSGDGVFKLWNLKEYQCQQSILLNYPSFEVLGKLIEWGTTSLYTGPTRYTKITSGTKSKSGDPDIFCFKKEQNGTVKRNEVLQSKKTNIILVTCCNFIAKINLIYENNLNSEQHVSLLPPPPLQNSVLVPETWKIGERKSEALVESEELSMELITIHQRFETDEFLKKIMTRDFLKDFPKHDMNYKVAKLALTKEEMRKPLSQCAPYLALELFEMEEVQLSDDLPIPPCRKTQQLADRTHRLLSAASTRSGLLSDRSSKSRSSRSSIIEF